MKKLIYNIIPHLYLLETKSQGDKLVRFGLVVVIGFLALSPSMVWADHCTVSKITIIPGPWENASNLISLTAQVQNENNEACHADNTIRISFSSSGGGSFSNQGQTAVPQAWISTNQTNRNFYYNSDTLESDSITLEAGYGSANDWSVSWTTTEEVADLLVDQEEDEDNDNGDLDSTPAISAHSSPAPLSNKVKKSILEVDAGRNRLTNTHFPVFFKAEIVESSENIKPEFNWSFGDGTSDQGEKVSHIYKFAGEYEVVLNASSREVESVDRLLVKVVDVKLDVSRTDVLNIHNLSGEEINIGKWVITDGENKFTVAQDTIVGKNKTIKFDSDTLGFGLSSQVNISILAPDETLIWPTEQKKDELVVDREEILAVAQQVSLEADRISNLLISRQLASLGQARNQVPTGQVSVVAQTSTTSENELPAGSASSSDDVIVLTPEKNRLSKILSLPVTGVGFLGSLFQ